MNQPVLTLAAAFTTNRKGREVLATTPLPQRLIQRCLYKATPISRVLFLDLLDSPAAQGSANIYRQLLGDLVRELVVGVGGKCRDMKRQHHLAARRVREYLPN